MAGLRKWMFENVYTNPIAKGEEGKAESMIEQMFDYYKKHPEHIPSEYIEHMERRGESLELVICDYIAGMTDRFFVSTYTDTMIPKAWKY
jgi:dGTPase